MKKIKAILLTVLGQRKYLQLTSSLFFVYFKKGWLTKNPIYKTHYFVKHLVKPGDTVIDIGANLGYFSVQFAQLVGRAGKVYSVEPIELYRHILIKNISRFKQVEILPYALGEMDAIIKMGNPGSDKHRHGLMRVLSDKDASDDSQVYEVPMKNPGELFASLPKINYIKCDIEGYEVPVIPLMRSLIEVHQPILQVETEGENRRIIFEMMHALHYSMYYVNDGKLQRYLHPDDHLPGDMICLPANHDKTIDGLIASN
jgi:FkbM family methyltransferase